MTAPTPTHPAAGDLLPVLDHGHVRLVDAMGSDLSVVRAARVSYQAAWRAGLDQGNDERLIRYLLRNQHSTPFEAVTFTFEVVAPLFVLRQWHRHRTWSYNEVSARYTELPELYYSPDPRHIGVQSTTNKQARDIHEMTLEELKSRDEQILAFERHCDSAFVLYRLLMDTGWPRELARCVLPLNTYSAMFATVNLHNLLHFLGLRLHEHAQYEIRMYAGALEHLAERVVPVTMAAWRDLRSQPVTNPT